MKRIRPARDNARDMLQNWLSDGPRPVCEVEQEAATTGISRRSLQRARKDLGVISIKNGFGANGSWSLQLAGRNDCAEPVRPAMANPMHRFQPVEQITFLTRVFPKTKAGEMGKKPLAMLQILGI